MLQQRCCLRKEAIMACNSRMGVYSIVTNGVIVNDGQVVFGVNPNCFRALPCEGLAVLKIRQEIPTAGGTLPAFIAVPTRSTVSTINEGNACNTVTNIPLVDPLGDAFVGSDFVNGTERLLYFNKTRGVLRVMDCCRPAATATA